MNEQLLKSLLELLLKTIITGFGLGLGALIFRIVWSKAKQHKKTIGIFLQTTVIFLACLSFVTFSCWLGYFVVQFQETHPPLAKFIGKFLDIYFLVSIAWLLTIGVKKIISKQSSNSK